MDMEKKRTHKGNLTEHQDDNFVEGSVSKRIGLVWPLTEEVASLSPNHNVKQRLQRHITVLTRRKG
jgi:hypothetical protein